MASLLFGVKPFDPLIYGVSGAVILVAALIASSIPARRAAFLESDRGATRRIGKSFMLCINRSFEQRVSGECQVFCVNAIG